MLWTILKFALPLLGALVAASLFTTKTFHVETTIPAPPEEVWRVLMDTASYPDWNPTFVRVVGSYELGAKMQSTVRDPEGKLLEMTATVRALEPARELRQSGGIPGIITFDHSWLLEPVAGGTKVVQHELDRGALLWFWNSDWIEPAYLQTNEALAARIVAAVE